MASSDDMDTGQNSEASKIASKLNEIRIAEIKNELLENESNYR